MVYSLMKKKSFTLLEILISITSFFLLMTIVINVYMWILTFRYSFQARSNLLQSTYYMFEKVNLLLRDYVIDYEEYFNRSQVWCDTVSPFSWDVWSNWYCDLFTAYGNQNTFRTSTGVHSLYHCSSVTWYTNSFEKVIYQDPLISWCALSWRQSFNQYSLQFLDVKDNSDFSISVINDSDDTDLWMWPEAVLYSTWVQELYLISKDKQYRVFIRRAYVEDYDLNGDGIISWDNESLYTLQILKLRSFDAWNNHDFDVSTSSGVYNWTLDTWTCDYSKWFICSWTSLGNVYSWYRLPIDSNDGWVNLFDKSITVTDRNIVVYPTKNPYLAWVEPQYQITPYFTISVTTKLYWWVWKKKLQWSVKDYQFSLQTTFTTKWNY